MKILAKAISFLLLIIVLSSSSVAQEQFRVWKTSDGKYTVEAKLKSQTENDVTIVKRDGAEVTVLLERLSEADRNYATDPFKNSAATKPKTRPKTGSSKKNKIKIPETEMWNVTSDPFTEQAKLGADLIDHYDAAARSLSPAIVLSRDRKNLFLFDQVLKSFVPEDQNLESFGRGRPIRLRAFDLDNGQMSNSPPVFMPECIPYDVSPDKSRFLVATRKTPGDPSPTLHVIAPEGKKVREVASWQPYKTSDRSQGLLDAKFIDNDHIMTFSANGLVGLWDANKLKLVWNLQVWPTTEPGLSPNRKLLFARVEKGIAAIEILTGKVVGLNFCDEIGMQKLSVNDSCERLVGIGAGICFEWDLSTGDLVSSFAVSPQLSVKLGRILRIGHVPITWVSDHQFLASPSGGLYDLIDLNAKCSVWLYALHWKPVVGADGRIWTPTWTSQTIENPPNLRAFRLPHEAAEIAIKDAIANPVVNFEADGKLPYSFSVEDPLWQQPEKANENAKLKLGKLGFSVNEISDSPDESEAYLAATLLGSKMKDQQKSVLMITDALFSVRYMGELLWKSEALMISNPSFQENPWKGKILPQSFRFYKPALDASVLHPDGSFGKAFYERRCTTHSLGGGTSMGNPKNPNIVPPGGRGIVPPGPGRSRR